MFDYELFCEDLKDNALKEDDLRKAFSTGLPMLINNGNVSGIRKLVDVIKKNPEHWSQNNISLKTAISYKDSDTALSMVNILKDIYDPSHVVFKSAVQNAIMNGKKRKACALLEIIDDKSKEACLHVLIATYNSSQDLELREGLIEIFECMIEDGQDFYDKSLLYHHILNHCSLFFIDYVCKYHSDIIQHEKLLFCRFAISTNSSQYMLSKLIKAGASLTWLTPANWGEALKNHKNTYSEKNYERFSVLMHDDVEVAKDIIPNCAIKGFIFEAAPLLLSSAESTDIDDINTLIFLSRRGFANAEWVMETILECIQKESKSCKDMESYFIEGIDVESRKFAMLSTALIIKSGRGLSVLKALSKENDLRKPVMFVKFAKGIPEFDDNIFDYVEAYDGVLDILASC